MSYKSDISKVVRTEEVSDFPGVVVIDNCSACNLQCSMCDHKNIRKYRKIQTMDFGLYRALIEEIARENPNVRVWEIFFGDPFLCRDIPKRIAYAKQAGLHDVVLNTNGALMTPEKSKAVIQAGLDSMYVGIDAVTETTYNQIRIGGDFDKVVNNVLSYYDLLHKFGNRKQEVYVQFVVNDLNEYEVDDFVAFWSRKDIKIKIRPKVSWAGLVKTENLRNNQGVTRKPCYWLMRTMVISADGRIPLCGADVHCRVVCGDANEKSIKELWHSKLKKYRTMHEEDRFSELPEMCYNCMDWQSTYAEFISPEKESEASDT